MNPKHTIALSTFGGAAAAALIAVLMWPGHDGLSPADVAPGRSTTDPAVVSALASILDELKAQRRGLRTRSAETRDGIRTDRYRENPMAGMEKLLREFVGRGGNGGETPQDNDLRDPNLIPSAKSRDQRAAKLTNQSDKEFRQDHFLLGYRDVLSRYGFPHNATLADSGTIWYYEDPDMQFYFSNGLVMTAYK
ncbi:MAG: hypothetical protein CMJ83_06485 [Planctomycetes bacterium]|nr:hypothetical protein [Planctomycetota bacterium]